MKTLETIMLWHEMEEAKATENAAKKKFETIEREYNSMLDAIEKLYVDLEDARAALYEATAVADDARREYRAAVAADCQKARAEYLNAVAAYLRKRGMAAPEMFEELKNW